MAPPKFKRQKIQYDPEVEARLQQVVFKDSEDLIKNLYKNEEKDVTVSNDTKDASKGQDSGISEENDEHDSVKSEESNDDEHDSEDSEESDVEEHDSDRDEESDVEEHDSDRDEENDEAEENGSDEDKEDDSDDEPEEDKPECTRVWFDIDEENNSVKNVLKIQQRRLPGGRLEKTYNELLENKFKSLVGTPKWAKIEQEKVEDSDDSDEELLQHSNRLKVTKDKKLPRGIIEIKALTDINTETHREGPLVTSLQFHPTSTVALVAGLSGVLSIFKVDGQDNNKLHSLQFEGFKINSAKFLRDGSEIIAGNRFVNYCQLYDLMSGKICKIQLPYGMTNMSKFEVSPDGKYIVVIGKKGEIFLMSAISKELIHTFKMNNKCVAMAFTPDSKNLITSGETEEIYVWDLNSRICVHRAIDDGCISGTSIAVSPSGQFLATGSKQGVVNIYETNTVLRERIPKPSKIVMNLDTAITSVKFNSTCEILTMASEHKENAFRMVHLPSFNVFSNFPTKRTTIYKALAIDFSPNSGFLGISNNKGCAHLYRLKHYGNY